MKKFILASAFALLATPALFAQSDNNTYNMQIELKNGTKITLGPNDLKNITFNEGAIQIEGNTIDELNAAINAKANELKAEMANLQKLVDVSSQKIAMLQELMENNEGSSDNAETLAKIASLESVVSMLKSEIDQLKSDYMTLKSTQAELKADQKELQAGQKTIENKLVQQDKDLTSTMDAIKVLQDELNKLQTSSGNNDNADKIAALQTAITALSANVDASEARIANTETQVKSLQEGQKKLESDSKAMQAELMKNRDEYTMFIASEEKDRKSETSQLNERIAVLQAMVAMTSDVNDAQEAKIEQLKQELKQQKSDLQDRIDALEAYIKHVDKVLQQHLNPE